MIISGDPAAFAGDEAPTGAAGFRFGMNPSEASQACVNAGGNWSSEPTTVCSKPPVTVGFDAKVRLEFCNVALCKIALIPTKERPSAKEQWAFYQRLTSALEKRYGKGAQSDDLRNISCGSMMDQCIEQGRVHLKTEWKWPSKPWIVASLDPAGGKVAIAVEYVDLPAQPPVQDEDAAEKTSKPVQPPGL